MRPGSQSWRWTLGPLGAALVAARRDQPPPRPATVRARTDRLAASPRLQHLLGVNQVFCALAAHARHRPGTRLARWWPESRATTACGGLARPDGHGLWHADGRTVAFWLEYDTGTEPLHRLADKLTGYAQLTATDLAYPVLFWLPTTAREHHLHTLLARTPTARRLTIATASTQHADTTSPAGPVWLLTGRADRVRLSALPITPGRDDATESIVDGGTWDA